MDDFQEYPKALYPGGDVTAAMVIVADEAEEADKRGEGYAAAHEEPKPATKKKGA